MSLRERILHVRSKDPQRARWQDRLEPIWEVVANGCRPNRRTLDTIRDAGFDVGEIEQAKLPGGSGVDAALRERGRSPLSDALERRRKRGEAP